MICLTALNLSIGFGFRCSMLQSFTGYRNNREHAWHAAASRVSETFSPEKRPTGYLGVEGLGRRSAFLRWAFQIFSTASSLRWIPASASAFVTIEQALSFCELSRRREARLRVARYPPPLDEDFHS